MKPTYKLLVFILGSLLGTANLHAQDKPAEKKPEPSGTLSEEIEVVRPYKPVLANAAKIRRNPDLTTAPIFKPVLSYQILDRKLELNTDIRQLQYQLGNTIHKRISDCKKVPQRLPFLGAPKRKSY